MLKRAFLYFLLFAASVGVNAGTASLEAPNWVMKKGEQAVGSMFLTGKPYVIHFWATWCPYCKRVQPGLDKLAKQFEKQGVETFAISFWENENADPEREMANRGLDLDVLVNGDEVAKSFGVQGTPTTVFVDKDGKIIVMLRASNPDAPELAAAYQSLLPQQ